jgi:hypothetical protein
MEESKARNIRPILFTAFRPVRSTAVRKMRTSTNEFGNKLPTVGLYTANIVVVRNLWSGLG